MNHLISFNVSENCLICNQFGDKLHLLSTTFTSHSKKPLIEIIGKKLIIIKMLLMFGSCRDNFSHVFHIRGLVNLPKMF